MKAAFYRPDYQNFLMCPLIKRLGRAFVSKHGAELLKRSAVLLKHSAGFWGLKRKLKAQPRVWKARLRVCVITRPMLSRSATVVIKYISQIALFSYRLLTQKFLKTCFWVVFLLRKIDSVLSEVTKFVDFSIEELIPMLILEPLTIPLILT